MKKQKRIVPNVVRGGVAIPLGANYFLMKGKTHEQGGIDIGKDLEVENGELMKIDKNNMTIVSNAPIMNGISPAEYALGGLKDGTFTDRFKEGFKYQEKYKDINGLKDDGTKARFGKDFEVPKIYLRTEDVFDEIDNIIYNNKNPKELSKALDDYWLSIENNISIPAEFKQNVKQDLEHYKKYPYASSLITRNRIDDQKRYEKDKSLRIPADYSKMITLSKAGKSTGITVTKNMLDSLAYRGGRAQADTVRVLGVPAQETGLGKFQGTTYMTPRQIRQDEEYYKIDRSENPSYFIREGGVNPTELVNNHYYYASSADQEALGAISRKTGVGHDTSGGNVIASIGYNEITPEVEEEAKKTWRYTTNKRAKENLDIHPLEQAYELDKSGNYNLGIDNHNELVQKRGEELWLSPEIQQWWKESGKQWYEQGKNETKKLGGKTQMKQIKRNNTSTGEKELAKYGKGFDTLSNRKFRKLQKNNINILHDLMMYQLSKEFGDDDLGGLPKLSDIKSKAKSNINSSDIKRRIIREVAPSIKEPLKSININLPQGASTVTKPAGFERKIEVLPEGPNINTPSLTTMEDYSRIKIPGIDTVLVSEPTFNQRVKLATAKTKNFIENNVDTIGDVTNGLVGIGSAIASHRINNKMLNNLEELPEITDSVPLSKTKLKTSYNIHPQLAKARRIANRLNRYVDRNTSSSQTAINRRRQNELDYLENFNTLYGQKENVENQLINQDRMLQHQTDQYNTQLANQDIVRRDTRKAENVQLRNTIAEKKAENSVALADNVSSIINNMIMNRKQARSHNKTLKVMAAGFPNISSDYLKELGLV